MMIMMIWLLPSRLSSSIVTKFLSQLADYTHGAHGHPRCPVITPTNPPTAGITRTEDSELKSCSDGLMMPVSVRKEWVARPLPEIMVCHHIEG